MFVCLCFVLFSFLAYSETCFVQHEGKIIFHLLDKTCFECKPVPVHFTPSLLDIVTEYQHMPDLDL